MFCAIAFIIMKSIVSFRPLAYVYDAYKLLLAVASKIFAGNFFPFGTPLQALVVGTIMFTYT